MSILLLKLSTSPFFIHVDALHVQYVRQLADSCEQSLYSFTVVTRQLNDQLIAHRVGRRQQHTSTLSNITVRPAATLLSGGKVSDTSFTILSASFIPDFPRSKALRLEAAF